MKYSKKKDLSGKKNNNLTELKDLSFEEYLQVSKTLKEIYKCIENIKINNNELTSTRFEYNTLEELINIIVDFDYKIDNEEYLTEALTEFYKKTKSIHDPVLISSVSSFATLKGAYGGYYPIFNKESKIDISNVRKLMYSGKSYYSIDEKKFGFAILSTMIHEMQHEKQDAILYRVIKDHKFTKRDLISSFYLLASEFQIGRFNPSYYDRYYEFEAEYTANKKMYNYLKQGIIENNRENKLKLYELVCNQLNNFNMNKIIGEQKRFTKNILETLKFLTLDNNCYDFINQYAIIDTILVNARHEVRDIYNIALSYYPKDISTKDKFEILLLVLDEFKNVMANEDLQIASTKIYNEEEFNKIDEKDLIVKAEKEIGKFVRQCILVSIEANEKEPDPNKLTAGRYILETIPKKFKTVDSIRKYFADIFDVEPIPEFEVFSKITENDIDEYSIKLKDEYNNLLQMSFDLQKDILNETTYEEKDYMIKHKSQSKYGNAETNGNYLKHIANGFSFDVGKSIYFIKDVLDAWDYSKLKKEKELKKEKAQELKLKNQTENKQENNLIQNSEELEITM